jgi:hypothetical protein
MIFSIIYSYTRTSSSCILISEQVLFNMEAKLTVTPTITSITIVRVIYYNNIIIFTCTFTAASTDLATCLADSVHAVTSELESETYKFAECSSV